MLPTDYEAEKLYQAKEREWERRARWGDFISSEIPKLPFYRKLLSAMGNRRKNRKQANKKG
ncbi:hypothetical protein [Paenibacillus paridis]|uniref:hypothetical protein n=1 Tax=Paenibacillus paridis TaxID=2583376 RepID=UPI00111F4BF7|nr:hypothetical protein [Paenibacillus paridis]